MSYKKLFQGLYQILKYCIYYVFVLFIAILPMFLVLDFGMGIQIERDYGKLINLLFGSAIIFFAEVYARYLRN